MAQIAYLFMSIFLTCGCTTAMKLIRQTSLRLSADPTNNFFPGVLNWDYLALLQIEETVSEEATVPVAADHNKGTFVSIGSSKEQDELKMKLINSAKEKFSDQKVQTTSREECALYAETRSCHPTSKSVHIKQLVCCSTVECWKRTNNRVSKELMTAKFNFGVEEITVEHHPATGELKKRVVASMAQIMGA